MQFCTQNKVHNVAMDELIKQGFTLLEALKLMKLDDLGSDKIPRGQRRLILHIVETLLLRGTANRTADTNVGEDDRTARVAVTTTRPAVTISQTVELDATQNDGNLTNEHADI